MKVANQSQFALHNLLVVCYQLELTFTDKCKLFDSLFWSILTLRRRNHRNYWWQTSWTSKLQICL